ncbi:MAG: hypothetical protein H8D23_17645 [Candidatus Brocadiales bacterium]|nr:hypothetical protein [Candidatus Brocadiales bacterium]
MLTEIWEAITGSGRAGRMFRLMGLLCWCWLLFSGAMVSIFSLLCWCFMVVLVMNDLWEEKEEEE